MQPCDAESAGSSSHADAVVEALRALFACHPSFVKAASQVVDGASSDIYFSHRPGEAWHLLRVSGESRLLEGASPDPDFVFRFSPESVRRLEQTGGGVDGFALALLALCTSDDPEAKVDFRLASSFSTLLARGYVALLFSAGAGVAAAAARFGARSPLGLKKLIDEARSAPFVFEIRG